MNIRIYFLLLAALVLLASAFSMGGFSRFLHSRVFSEGSAQITSPRDGAEIEGEKKNDLVYDFHPSHSGRRLRIDVDGENVDVEREWRGSYRLPLLGWGRHEICVRETDASGAATGLAKCITVTAK